MSWHGDCPRFAVASPSTSSQDDESSLPADRDVLWSEFRMLTLVVVVVAAVTVFVLATGVFLMAFASVLVAVMFFDLSDLLASHSPLSRSWALPVVFVALLVLAGGFVWLTAPNIMAQLDQVADRLPQAFQAIDQRVSGWLGGTADGSFQDLLPTAQSVIGSLPMIVNTTFGILGSLVVVAALGVYLAAHPARYRDAAVGLFASSRRRQVCDTLNGIGESLRRWLRGQLLAMVLMGVTSYVVLKLLGVPLALTLAVITGLLELVPYIGAFAAGVPVVLVALTESWHLALYALIAYTALQTLEGYAMIPLIQRRAIDVPPAVIIFMQVLLGVLFGIVGIVLATPLCGALAVVVRRCYVDAVLEENGE